MEGFQVRGQTKNIQMGVQLIIPETMKCTSLFFYLVMSHSWNKSTELADRLQSPAEKLATVWEGGILLKTCMDVDLSGLILPMFSFYS